MSSGLAADSLDRQQRATLLASIAALSLLAWLTIGLGHASGDALHEHLLTPHATPAGPGGFAVAFSMWMMMMVGMMLPVVSPWIMLFAGSSRRLDPSGAVYFPTALFASGYFVIWIAYSLVASWVQLALQQRSFLHSERLALDPKLGGALLLVAGLFQLTPLKSACLRHCRTPLGFLLANWRPGRIGALRLGLRHGAYCLGCCWVLMALSFGLGVMNLLWMVALTLFLCVEKIAPFGVTAGRIFGVACVAWGGGLLWLS